MATITADISELELQINGLLESEGLDKVIDHLSALRADVVFGKLRSAVGADSTREVVIPLRLGSDIELLRAAMRTRELGVVHASPPVTAL